MTHLDDTETKVIATLHEHEGVGVYIIQKGDNPFWVGTRFFEGEEIEPFPHVELDPRQAFTTVAAIGGSLLLGKGKQPDMGSPEQVIMAGASGLLSLLCTFAEEHELGPWISSIAMWLPTMYQSSAAAGRKVIVAHTIDSRFDGEACRN